MGTAGRVLLKLSQVHQNFCPWQVWRKTVKQHMYIAMWTMYVDVACAACWVGKLNFASSRDSGRTALPEQKTQQVKWEKGLKQDML